MNRMSMRAAGFWHHGPADVMGEVEVPVPQLRPGFVRIKVRAAAVNPADLAMRAGTSRLATEGSPPWIPGMDAAGVIDDVPDDVTDLQAGDRVMAVVVPIRGRYGAQAEYVLVPRQSVIRTPESLTDLEAAALPMNGLTAVIAARILDGTPAVVGVTGGGGYLASLFIPLAVQRGWRVLADAAAADESRVASLGAEPLPRERCFTASLRNIAALGADVVLDTASLGPAAAGAVRDGGVLAAVRPADEIEPRVRVARITVGQHAKDQEALNEVREAAAAGIFVPRVAEMYAPADAGAAHRQMEAGGVRGRILIDFR